MAWDRRDALLLALWRRDPCAVRSVWQACQEVQDCKLLAEVLKVALMVGNFLNAGNKNGAAAGFQIDALLKLRDVKSTRSRWMGY